jgi:drug/metabolite transporter (DMT)-like permease
MSTSTGRGRVDRATLLAFIGVVVFGGVNAVAVRQTVLELPPFWAAAIRFGIAGAVLAAIAWRRGWSIRTPGNLRGTVLYGLVGFTAAFAFINAGLTQVPGGTGSVLVAMAPLMTLLLAVAHRQETFRLRGLVGATIAVGGVAIVFADQLDTNVPLASLLLVLLGAACISEASIIAKGLPRSDPIGTNAIGMLVAVPGLLALSALAGEPQVLPERTSTWIALVYLIVFGSIVVFTLAVFTLRTLPASVVSYQTLLLPLVGVTVATLLTGERFSPSFLVGGAVMLVGVYVGVVHGPRLPGRAPGTSG